MMSIERVFCDESGNTGQNLADLSQPVFAFAATVIDRTDAERLLAPFAVLNQAELKYSKVRKTTKGQRLIEAFLNDRSIHGGTSKVYLVHKPFMVVTKMVDMIYEPLSRAAGENFYSQKTGLATANLLATAYPVLGGRTRFYRLLESFVKAVRSKAPDSLHRFFTEVHKFRDHLREQHGEDGGLELVPLLVEERVGAPHILAASTDELDPIVPAFNVHAAHWSRESSRRFAVVSDDSSTLERNHQVFLDYSNPAGKPISVEYYGEKIEYPLKIDRFEFVDSRNEPSIRIADLLAGMAAEAAVPMANRERPNPYEKALITAVVDRGLVLNAIWPTADVTPETLDAGETTDVNPAALAVEFLESIPRRSCRSRPRAG